MIRRRNFKLPSGGPAHTYTLDGKKTPGVTTILNATMPKPALIRWASNVTARFAVDYWDELGGQLVSERLARLQNAASEERDAAARRGTEVHTLASQLAAGEKVGVPDELAGHVEAYQDFLDLIDPRTVAVELVLANRKLKYCGTTDAIFDMPDLAWEGSTISARRWLIDIKTSRGIYDDHALQVVAYCHADSYVRATDQDSEYPFADLGVSQAGLLHVRSDGWDLYPVDMGKEPWEYFQRLRWLYERKDQPGTWTFPAIDPPFRWLLQDREIG